MGLLALVTVLPQASADLADDPASCATAFLSASLQEWASGTGQTAHDDALASIVLLAETVAPLFEDPANFTGPGPTQPTPRVPSTRALHDAATDQLVHAASLLREEVSSGLPGTCLGRETVLDEDVEILTSILARLAHAAPHQLDEVEGDANAVLCTLPPGFCT